MIRSTVLAIVVICTSLTAFGQNNGSLLFYLSGENGTSADYAIGDSTPNFISNISSIEDGAVGKALRCGLKQRLAYKAPGNIYSRCGTLAFWWRANDPVGPTEFPIFRVGFADHSSWDMCWLRIDYNGHGFDAFVTDNNLARIRVSTTVDPMPAADEWTHLALTWDEAKGIRFYQNGKLAACRDTSAVLDIGLDQFGPHSRIISPYQVQSAYTMQRGGDIDELYIFGQALADDEIVGLTKCNQNQIDAEYHDSSTALKHYHGFDATTPPYLSDDVTTVRKVEIRDCYDLKRWWWKACDGIAETTWPGVFNWSRIEGRADYFILPDSDCYSNSGKQIRFNMPYEDWNHIEITGGAYGKLSVSTNNDGSQPLDLGRKEFGSQHGTFRLDKPQKGETLIFTNDVQETPIQEFSVYNVTRGDAPEGYARMSYVLSDFKDYSHPQLTQIRSYIEGRHIPAERQLLLASPAGNKKSVIADFAEEHNMVHIVIPSDFRDLDINEKLSIENATVGDNWKGIGNTTSWRKICGGLDGIRITIPGLNLASNKDGFIPINIQVKDPLWEMRSMFDFSFSVKPGEERTLWLDLRDRILPDDRPLYIKLCCPGCGFKASELKDMKIELIFKELEQAKTEHIADRLTQIRDAHSMLVEEGTANHRYSKFEQIDRDMNDLLRVDPYNKLGRCYWSFYYKGQPGPEYIQPQCPAGIPEWAFVQLELLKQYRHIVEWYIDNRQIENGEFGGGISDDTDLLNRFVGLYYCGIIPDKVRNSVHMFMDAIDREGTLTKGVSTIQTDGLHTYEEGANTLCHINCTETGDPKQAERLMESFKTIREHVLGINDAGHLHFRSDYFSATKIATEWPWTWSSFRETMNLAPGLMLGEFYGNMKAREIILQFADSMLEHKRYKDGVIQLPLEICFTDDSERMWGLRFIGAIFCYAYHWTGEEKYLEVYKASGYAGFTHSKEDFVRLGRDELRRNAIMEFINTEGSVWTDRLRFDVDLIQESRLGGIAMNRWEHMVPLNLVGWKFDKDEDADKVAIHFEKSERDNFSVVFFNTSKKTVSVTMSGVETLGGEWEMNYNSHKKLVNFGRGRKLSFKIPPGKEYQMNMRLISKGVDFNHLPDLAISSSDIELDGNMLRVTAHNISGVSIDGMRICFADSNGKKLIEKEVPNIPAPSDFLPKTAMIIFDIPDNFKNGNYQIILDPDNMIEEIYEENNIAEFYLTTK